MQRCMGCMREFAEGLTACPHCGYVVGTPVANKSHLEPGTVLQERYTLGRVLGQGGFGITYIAWDTKLGRAVAVKEYLPNVWASRLSGEKVISCFSDESRRQFEIGLQKTRKETLALTRFDALESVVRVYDCVEENGTAYIVMELLRGKTVKELLIERGTVPFGEAVQIITPVLLTLDAMHREGMIHRDVAPDNIFLCEDGRIKLLDFGAARIVTGSDGKSLSVVLKHGYAPFEQYSSKGRQGPFTDVYAATATVCRMVTGIVPDEATDRVMHDTMPQKLEGKCTAAQKAVLLRGLSVRAEDRQQSAMELLDDLHRAAAPVTMPQTAMPPTQAGATVPLGYDEPQPQPPQAVGYAALSAEEAENAETQPDGLIGKIIHVRKYILLSIAALAVILAVVIGGNAVMRSIAKKENTDSETTVMSETGMIQEAAEENEIVTQPATTAPQVINARLNLTSAKVFDAADRLDPTQADLDRLATLLDGTSYSDKDYDSSGSSVLEWIAGIVCPYKGMETYDLLLEGENYFLKEESYTDPKQCFEHGYYQIQADVMEYYMENVFHNFSYSSAREHITRSNDDDCDYYYADGWYYFEYRPIGLSGIPCVRKHDLLSSGHEMVIVDTVNYETEDPNGEVIATTLVDAALTLKDGRRLWTIYSTKVTYNRYN